jgi:hypothetical protein
MENKLRISLFGLVLTVILCGVHAGFDIKPDIPVPSINHGLRYLPASPRPRVILEFFYEVHCSDSERGWGVMKSLQQHYGADKLDLVLQHYVLPYHRNAFLGTQGIYLILNSTVSDRVFAYIEESLRMNQNYTTAATIAMTETEVLDMMADMAHRVTGIDKTEFTSNINNYIAATRIAWKYGAKHGVAATPTYFVNGVELGIGTSVPTYDDWITFLDPIIGI